ncbi:hypothetical protein TSAR_016851 [Trichomalopsis sarcophagae]|uniref:Uncharacterized protein n=1 Tax=Trichomalopsis sarcophagae TaxID=543379 RepID=A0A232EHG3_9HYME|nr:hypothetical protein TSAR_016851 [Trichomalopsis sarcophagae]
MSGEIPPTFVSFDVINHTALHEMVTRAERKVCESVYSKLRFVANNKSYMCGSKLRAGNSETCFISMEHASKMILVPQECIESQQIRQCLSITPAAALPPPSKTTITDECGAGSSNDNHLNTVQTPSSVYSTNQQVLQRFLHYKKQSIKLLPTVDKTLLPLHSITANGDGEVISDLHIINSVPPSLLRNTRKLMNSLRRSGSIA